MKVYVMTESKMLGIEKYIGVKKSVSEAEKALRKIAPYMRPAASANKETKAYVSDASYNFMLFIHEEEI